MSTYENGHWVPWRPDMIASKGSVLHGRNSAFVPPPPPSRDRAKTAGILRTMRLVVWAAKCHTHSQESHMPLGNLPHSYEEVNLAIAAVEKIVGHPGTHEDEGVKVRSKRVH